MKIKYVFVVGVISAGFISSSFAYELCPGPAQDLSLSEDTFVGAGYADSISKISCIYEKPDGQILSLPMPGTYSKPSIGSGKWQQSVQVVGDMTCTSVAGQSDCPF
jgi:hypothetical protein